AAVGAGPVSQYGAGLWAWLMQRVTAVLIVLFLGTHWWVLHYAVVGEAVNFDRVTQRLQSPFFVVLDLALLAVLFYHGLNGVRAILIDFGMRAGATLSAVTWFLWLVGVGTFIYGANALLPFRGVKAWF
ncbi:MAG: hypothetical protein Q8O76_14795, partial [Chloroflexota bacterium]|nr:hypothetical protein [Chloroflexota bacterium]